MPPSPLPPDLAAEVRAVVAEVLRDVLPPAGSPRSAPPARPAGAGQPASRVESVRITGDADLQGFALRLLEAFENPKTREDVRHGRLTFALTGGVAAPSAAGAVHRVERGAVTERQVAAAAAQGQRLVLGPRAVLTPLGREKARALQVPVEKERP